MSYDPTPEPTTTGGSGMTTFLIILFGFLVLCLLCCGGVFVGTFWIGARTVEQVKQAADRAVFESSDPEEIVANTESVVAFDPPEGMQPKHFWEFSNPFNDELFMSASTYEDPASGIVLMICEFGKLYQGSLDAEQLRRQMEQSLEEQGADVPQDVNPDQIDTVQATINGEPVSFVKFRGKSQGQQPDGGAEQQERVVVQGTFKTDRGTGFLLLQGPSDQLTDGEIDQFVESLE